MVLRPTLGERISHLYGDGFFLVHRFKSRLPQKVLYMVTLQITCRLVDYMWYRKNDNKSCFYFML